MSCIGEYIRELRIAKGTPLKEAASSMDIPVWLLDSIEQGRRYPATDQIIQIANYFGITEKDMLITHLEALMVQASRKTGTSKRSQSLVREVAQLSSRQLQARIHKPLFPLNTCIESIIYHKGSNIDCSHTRVFPDGVVQLILSLDDHDRTLISGDSNHSSLTLKKAWVTGVQKQHMTYQSHRNETTLCIRFTHGGFYALTNIPLTTIHTAAIDADLVFGSSILSLRERIACCTDITTMFRTVEQYFLTVNTKSSNEFQITKYVCDHIDTPIQQLVQKTGYSQKHIIHLFKKHIGISPKYFQRITRFNKVLYDIVSNTSAIDWWDILFNHGYFDQPHFVKEFNHFAGMSPGSYLNTGSTCTRFLHLNSTR